MRFKAIHAYIPSIPFHIFICADDTKRTSSTAHATQRSRWEGAVRLICPITPFHPFRPSKTNRTKNQRVLPLMEILQSVRVCSSGISKRRYKAYLLRVCPSWFCGRARTDVGFPSRAYHKTRISFISIHVQTPTYIEKNDQRKTNHTDTSSPTMYDTISQRTQKKTVTAKQANKQ